MSASRDTRQALLDGALECLVERGYARTTVRDIAAASGANLALVAYYFGSKEALLNEALIGAFRSWTAQLGAAMEQASGPPLERLGTAARQLERAFAEQRPLLVAFTEALAQAAHSEPLRTQLADGYEALRGDAAALLGAADQSLQAPELAALLVALTDGLMIQWLLDPERAPRPGQLLEPLAGLLPSAG